MEDAKVSLIRYREQLAQVSEAIKTAKEEQEIKSLSLLSLDLEELIKLTTQTIDSSQNNMSPRGNKNPVLKSQSSDLDSEYELFMQEMAQSGACDNNTTIEPECSKQNVDEIREDHSDIEEELSSLLGMKCGVYHTHRWGGQPSLHNAMVCAVVPRDTHQSFDDLQVQVLFTHPTHTEMLPCPFYLNGECKFSDEQCRYSHGTVVQLSNLKDAIEPDYESIRAGSRILVKLKPPGDQDISLTRKSSEKYHLWHRAVVSSVDQEARSCTVKLESGTTAGAKRKNSGLEEINIKFEECFPLSGEAEDLSESDDSLSDTEYPEQKMARGSAGAPPTATTSCATAPAAFADWEKHTRGIGSKLMLAMGYVWGAGLGAAGAGRVQPVEARVLPRGKGLDACSSQSQFTPGRDPLNVELRLKRLQKKEEERSKRRHEQELEREKRNVFNFLNKTLGNKEDNCETSIGNITDIKQSTTKSLNVENFKISEDTKKVQRDLLKLTNSLERCDSHSIAYNNINKQIEEKNKELNLLMKKASQITKEQDRRKDKQKMTIF